MSLISDVSFRSRAGKLSAGVVPAPVAQNGHSKQTLKAVPGMAALLALLVAIVAASAPQAAAQVNFSGFGPVGGAGSFPTALGTAVDALGNIYVANEAGTVNEIPASCIAGANNASCVVQLGVGAFNNPVGIAVDGSGDVFVTDLSYLHTGVFVIPASCIAGANNASCVLQLGVGAFEAPYGVAVNANGDVFVANLYSTDDGGVYEIPASCIAGANDSTCVNLIYDAYSMDQTAINVALDTHGNLYASLFYGATNGIIEIEAVGGVISSSSPIKAIGAGNIVYAYGLTVDGSGNLFYANLAGPAGPALNEVPASCIAGANNASCTLTRAAGFTDPAGLAINGQGQLIVADQSSGTVYQQSPLVQSASFGLPNVCPAGSTSPAPCSQTLNLAFNVAAGTKIGQIKYLTTGSSNSDFTAQTPDTSATLCHDHSFAAAGACTVDVTFTPAAPGPRNGEIEIYDRHNNLLSAIFVYGVGVGPAIAFNPSPQTTWGSGLSYPGAVAVSAQRRIFVADSGNDAIKEINAATGGPIQTLGGGFSVPQSVAIDGSGNVFVADYGNGAVKEIPATCIAGANDSTCVLTLGGGFAFSTPVGVAVDGAGNLYVADDGNGAIYELPQSGGYATVATLASGYYQPGGVAVDGQGDVYFTANFTAVYEIVANGGLIPATPTINELSNAFLGVQGVAADAAGNVYVADSSAAAVDEISPVSGGGYSAPVSLGTGFSFPYDVAVDGKGNLYVADYALTSIVELERAQAPHSFNFHNLMLGQTSSPQSVLIQNVGNATLSGSGLTVSPNWLQVPGSGTPADCTASFSLNAAAGCNISIAFQPVDPGKLAGSLTLADNSLNLNPATQTIALAGDAEPAQQTVTFTTVPPQTIGAVVTLSATASSGLTNFTFTSKSPAICTVSGDQVTTIKAGWCDLKVVQPGNASWLPASAQQLVKVNP